MAGDARTVLVNLRANTSGFTSSMAKAKAEVSKLDAEQDKAQRRAEKWKAVGRASQAAGAAMAAGLLVAATAADKQEQAMRGLSAVFREQTPLMTKHAQEAANFGLSQAEYAEHASRLGAMLKNLGMEQDVLGQSTHDLMLKASDLYSMFGHEQGLGGAVDAIAALLRKERDPIEQFAISVKDVGVKAEMAATGANELDATLALLHKQMEMGGSLGAYTRNQDLLTVQLGELKAEVSNAAAALGKDLVPALTSIAQGVKSAVQVFNELPGPVKATVGIIAALTSALLLLGPKLVQTGAHIAILKANLATMGPMAQRAAGALGVLGTAAKASMLPLTALMAVFGGFAMHAANVKARGEELAGTLDEITGAATELTHQNLADEFLRNFDLSDLRDLQGMGLDLTIGEITHAAVEGGQAFDDMMLKIRDFKASAHGLEGFNPFGQRADSLENAALAARRDAEAMNAVQEATRQAGDASAAAQQKVDGLTQAQRAQQQAVASLVNDLSTLIGLNLAMGGSKDALLGQTDRLTQALQANGKAYSGNTQGAIANRQAIDQEMQKVLALGNAIYESEKALGDEGAAREKANAAISKHTANLLNNARQANFSEREIAKMAKRIGEVKGKQVVVEAKPKGTKQTGAEMDKVKGKADRLAAKEYVAKVKAQDATKSEGEMEDVKRAAENIPDFAKSTIEAVNALLAKGQIDQVHQAALRADGTYYVRMVTTHEERKAGGGMVRGPGTSTSDSIPARLSDGEYVLRAAAVDRIGEDVLDAMNSTGEIPEDEYEEGFARGGRARRRRRRRKRRQSRRATFAPASTSDYIARQRAAAQAQRERQAQREWQKEQDRLRKQRENAKKRARLEREAERAQAYLSKRQQKIAGKDGILSAKEYKKLKKTKEWKAAQKAAKALAQFDQQTNDVMTANREAWEDASAHLSAEERAAQEAARKAEEDRAAAERAREEAERKQVAKTLDAWEKYARLAEQKLAFIDRVRDAVKGNFNALEAFDYGKYKTATEAVKDASERVADAREALAKTSSGADRRAAQDRLREAKEEEARLSKEADAARHTPANIMKAYADQLANAKSFTSSVHALKKKGLSGEILEQLATGDPEQLKEQLAALNSLSIAQIQQINSQQAQVSSLGTALGKDLGTKFDAGISNANAALNLQIAATPVSIDIDGKTIAQALIDYQRKTGVRI
jgi:hypothetical protein